ncbi:hypothetical protein [Streptomyces sp. NPDC058045]
MTGRRTPRPADALAAAHQRLAWLHDAATRIGPPPATTPWPARAICRRC